MSLPSNLISPEVGLIKPNNILAKVVFPLPLSPAIALIIGFFSSMFILISFTAKVVDFFTNNPDVNIFTKFFPSRI